jgi:hypothetical protein
VDARSSSGRLSRFRKNLYGCLRRRADALFELIDSMLVVGAVSSPPHLSLAPVHRRGWGSLYAALSKGRIDEDALRTLLVRHPLMEREIRTWICCGELTSAASISNM